MFLDYHVHPDYSHDSRGGSIDNFCQRALEIGLQEICFTTHYDNDPARLDIDGFVNVKGKVVSVTSNWLDEYLFEIEEAKERYKGEGLRVLAGLEVEYGPDFEERIRDDLLGYSFNYLLGAIHCLDHQPLSVEPESGEYFQSHTPAEVCEEYYATAKKLIESGLFQAVAHLDFYKRLGIRYYGEEILSAHRNFAEPVLRLIAERGLALEINALGYKDGFGEPYPSIALLEEAKRQGVSWVTVGADCHSLDRLGANIEETLSLIQEFGFKLWRIGAQIG